MIEKYKPYRIDIVLDNDCNLSCVGCIRITYQNKTSINHIQFIEDIIENGNINRYHIHFTGGEPLLKWELIEKIISGVVKISKSLLKFSLYSNLTILNNEIIDFIKKYNIALHTSIDGSMVENNLIRGGGTFELVINNIKRLKKEDVEVSSITTTLKDGNFGLISTSFIDELQELDVKTWRLNIDYYGLGIGSGELIEKVFTLYKYAYGKGINVEGTWLYPFVNIVTDNRNGFCPATKGETISILPDGKISMCPYSETFLGTFENNWHNINKEFNVVKENISVNEKCTTCIIKDYCQTQCLITREQNDMELFDWYCKVYRGLTTKLLNYHIQN